MPSSGDDFLSPSSVSARPTAANSADRGFNRLAGTEAARVLNQYGGAYKDPKIQRLLTRIAAPLVALPENQAIRYQITVLNSPATNAFSLPDGTIFITRGMLALANDASEVAGIIAHEMGHVIARHAAKRVSFIQGEKKNLLMEGAAASDSAGKSGTASDRDLKIASFSRDQELEADRIGIRLSSQAGYDPYASARFLDAMARYHVLQTGAGKISGQQNFFSGHPTSPERIVAIKRNAAGFGLPRTGDDGRDYFLDGIDGLLYGDKPGQGYVRGRRFLHSDFGIGFEVPLGFHIDNGASQVVANGPNDFAIRFDAVKAPSGDTAISYIRRGWVAGLQESSVKPLQIGKFDAAKADAKTSKWDFEVTVIHSGDRMYRLLFAGPAGNRDIERIASQTEASFRSLTEDERGNLGPLHIQIVTVRPGDTLRSLAQRMEGTEKPEELLRVLNGLSHDAKLMPGKRVKIVAM